jgi:hypothetical protein
MSGIFVSHTHSDQPLADAIAALINVLFDREVLVHYSSKKELEGGVAPGADWFRWIVEQVRESDAAFILLTPASIQEPWVIWEAGAVAGAAFATAAEKARVFPITFGIKTSDVPTPFARTQMVTGTTDSDMLKLVDDLFERFGRKYTVQEANRFGARKGPAVKEYIDRVNLIIKKLPTLITEPVIQEWLQRLNFMELTSSFSEAAVFEDWIDIALRREKDDRQRPIDVRIHRRLGELYAAADQPSESACQFELARQLSPRDIFVLKLLGKAYLRQKDLKSAGEVLADMQELDAAAFERNVENAALKAQWFAESGNIIAARDLLVIAYKNFPSSYYLGDQLGKVLIELREFNKAEEVYRQVSHTIALLRAQNVWTLASALCAAIVCEDKTSVKLTLNRLR